MKECVRVCVYVCVCIGVRWNERVYEWSKAHNILVFCDKWKVKVNQEGKSMELTEKSNRKKGEERERQWKKN